MGKMGWVITAVIAVVIDIVQFLIGFFGAWLSVFVIGAFIVAVNEGADPIYRRSGRSIFLNARNFNDKTLGSFAFAVVRNRSRRINWRHGFILDHRRVVYMEIC